MVDYKNAYLISLSYDGSDYFGWVKQKKQSKTIQQTLEIALKKVIKTTDFYIVGASKTDTGVHALDQKVLFLTNFIIKNLSSFKAGVNKALNDDVSINEIENVDLNFNVHQVKDKEYVYFLNDGKFDVFKQRFTTYVTPRIDEIKLQEILNLFVGTHDFFLFTGLSLKEKENFQTTRTINEIKVQRNGDQIAITFKAKGFLRYQIRMIMGASLVCLTNNSKLNEQQIIEKLKNDSTNTKAPFIAKPNGLFLKKINY